MRIIIEQQGPATVVTIDGRSEYGHSADALVERLAPELARMLLNRWQRRAAGCVRLTYEEHAPTRTELDAR